MPASTFARLSSPLLLALALAAAACSGNSGGSYLGGPCVDEPPDCGTYCPGAGDAYAFCSSDGWECPDLVVCDQPDAGEADAGVGCEDSTSLDCGDCNGTSIAPVCTTAGLACPVVSCPVELSDGGVDASADAGRDSGKDAGADAGKDAATNDAGTYDAGGDTCLEGAPCNAGEECSVGTDAGPITSCFCSFGAYVCQ